MGLLSFSIAQQNDSDFLYGLFPEDFEWGLLKYFKNVIEYRINVIIMVNKKYSPCWPSKHLLYITIYMLYIF